MEKCLHILPMKNLSGAEKIVLLICKNLKNYEPVVICGGWELNNVFKNNDIDSKEVNFSKTHIFNALTSIKKVIKEKNIRIVHAHDNTASIYAYLIRKFYKVDIKIISHVHSCYPFLNEGGIYKYIDSIFRSKYDFNVLCGKDIYNFYSSNASYFPNNKWDILSNAVDIKNIENYNSKDRSKLREDYNIKSDEIVMGYVGRLCHIKGILPFMREVIMYKDLFKGAKILIIGSGEEEEEIKELVVKEKLDKLFIIIEFQEDIYKFYPMMDLFFLPSKYEGLPMVILEAMAFKLPVVSMDVGSIGELLQEDRGILVEKGQYYKFIQNLVKLKENPEMFKLISETGYIHVVNNYNIEKYVDKLEKIYLNIEYKETKNETITNSIHTNL